MRIQTNFVEVGRFVQINSGVTCRQKCNGCKKDWHLTGTEFVNRAVTVVLENGKAVEKVYYLCTGCVEKIKADPAQTLESFCK